MGYVTVATANAGKDGMEMPVKYGLEMNIPKYKTKEYIF